MNEEWRAVVGYEGVYEISDAGRVRRIGGGVRGAVVGRILRQGFSRSRVALVALKNRDRAKTHNVHVLVAAAFLGPRPVGLEINHKDGDRRNNAVANLEYVTPSENMLHAYRIGLRRGFAR